MQAYTQQDGELIPGEIIGIGTAEKCRELSNALNKGNMTLEQAKQAFEALPVQQPGYGAMERTGHGG